MWLIISLLFILYILFSNKKESFNPHLEKLPYKRENNIQVEQPDTSFIKDLDFEPELDINDGKEIREIYDAIVDDGRIQDGRFDEIQVMQPYEYYEFDKKNDYGFTQFPSY